MGAGGVTVKEGFTVADPEDAAVKALAAARARQTYMLVDSSKFGRIGAAAVLHIDEASVITDRAPAREFQDYTEVTVEYGKKTEKNGKRETSTSQLEK